MRIRKLSNGDLLSPEGGPVPDVPAGYERNPSNPYHLILQLEPCVYRVGTLVKTPCGKLRCFYNCSLHNKDVNSSICSDCFDITEPTNEVQ